MQTKDKELTGYPSIDKPWLKYYSKEALSAELPEGTMYDYLHENNKDHLEDIALRYFGRSISYGDLFEQIRKCCASLTALGVKPGDIITIQALTIPQVVVLVYAISRIGAVANMIYATDTEEVVNDILKSTRSKIYIAIDKIYEKFDKVLDGSEVENVILLSIASEMDVVTRTLYGITEGGGKRKVANSERLWKDFIKLGENRTFQEVHEKELPAVMVYTGGTTGKSKAVILSNKSINALVFQYQCANMGFVRQGVFMDVLPPFIAFGLAVSLHLPLCVGVKTVLCTDPSAQNVGKMFAKYKPNYLVAGTVQMEGVLASEKVQKLDMSFLKILAVGGDALPGTLEQAINDFLVSRNCSIRVFQGYGMSELAATVCTGRPDLCKFGTVGIPLPRTNVQILDVETGDELKVGQQGEVCIQAPSVMDGYFQNEEETKSILIKHEDGLQWIHTGDIGSVDEEGYLTIVGRIKRVIVKREGEIVYKVYPKLLEEKLERINGVRAVAVVGRFKTNTEQEAVAYIVPSEECNTDELKEKLEEYAKKHFKSYEQIDEYHFINELPRTKIGKVDFRALEEL